ncbi:MAG: hypothetical protein BWZ07_02984 [Alphaproteobacteria bacterium ADurb.BinA280]|nr:MAG: hypothetical protein BWZ07_02984 [Alphaproteobacteria bacterium ADurb.BinA280]
MFRAHVAARAQRQPVSGNSITDLTTRQRNTEIGQLRTARGIEQDVFRLDIAMHDTACMRIAKGVQQGTQYIGDFLFVVLQVALRQIAAGQPRHDIKRLSAGRAPHVVHAHDRWVLQTRNDARLVFKAQRQLLVL